MENRFHVTKRISTLVHIYTSKHRFAVSFHQIKHKAYWKLETSNSGLQYYCRWVGKGKTTQNNDTYSITSPWLKEKNDRFKTSKWTSYIKKTMHFNMTRKAKLPEMFSSGLLEVTSLRCCAILVPKLTRVCLMYFQAFL